MFYFIQAYLVLSIGIAITGGLHAGWIAGLSAIGTSAFSLIAGGGLKSVFRWGDKDQKIYCPLIAAVLMGLVYWMSGNFSVQFFGHSLTGITWGCIGFAICFVCTDEKLAGEQQEEITKKIKE